jgi:hypothetical protein
MDNSNKLWPVDQLLKEISKVESKYIKIKSNDLSVVISILSFADNETLKCFPSIESIAARCLKTPRRVRDVIKRLIKNEIFKITHRYKPEGDMDSNLYEFYPQNIWKAGAKCILPTKKRWGTNDTYGRVQMTPTGRVQMTPLTTHTTTHITKRAFVQKEKNEKKHSFSFSMDQMANEERHIKMHEQLKKIERGDPMPDNIRREINKALGQLK